MIIVQVLIVFNHSPLVIYGVQKHKNSQQSNPVSPNCILFCDANGLIMLAEKFNNVHHSSVSLVWIVNNGKTNYN